MLPRHVLRVSLALLVVAALAPRTASAQVFWQFSQDGLPRYIFTLSAVGVPTDPLGGEINGTTPPRGTIGEIAIAEAVLQPGEQVPLPVYADGTSASENEVFWTAHFWRADFLEHPGYDTSPRYNVGDHCQGGFTGRTWGGGEAAIGTNSGINAPRAAFSVMVTVIAVRSAAPTPAARQPWGSLKAKYR